MENPAPLGFLKKSNSGWEMRPFREGTAAGKFLFSDAEAAEDFAEDVFGVGVADDAAQKIQSGAKLYGGEFGRFVGLN